MKSVQLSKYIEIKDYSFITLGLILYSIGFVCFLLPYKITTGGVTGAASVIYYATGFMKVQYTYFLVNIFLLIAAIKILGPKFFVKTIYAVVTLTILLSVVQALIKQDDGTLPRFVGDQTFMACVLGASLEGLGLGIIFYNNGSTGGTDIIAAIVNKYRDVSIGQMMMLCDIFIITSSIIIVKEPQLLLCGYASLLICN
ncbi:MAG: YitT family protein, partial [Bacteroidaceae bacterium]